MNLQKVFPYRLITFDVTNTLIKFTANIGKTYGEIGQKYGVKCDTNELTESFKNQFKRMNDEIPHFGVNNGLSWQNWWKSVVFDTFKNCQSDISDSTLNAIFEELIEIYKTEYCWKPATGAFELLNYLKGRGVTLGVISNSDPRIHDILKNVRMASYFKFVLTSYEVGVSKPDQRIFLKAMKESTLDNLRGEHCLHIGDNIKFDYEGAKRSEWNSFLISSKKLSESSNSIALQNDIFLNLRCLKQHMEDKWNFHIVTEV